ncbi:MAG TPA: histidine kinase, partial [Parapedobacter sp.]|nr:histidine kinase [Parapedobacter sp.]
IESDDSTRVVMMIELSREMHRVVRQGNEDIRMATQAMETAAALDTFLYARAIDNLGLLYRFYQQYREAITFHARAYELIADREGHAVDKMRYANNAGVACRYNADYDLAVDYHMKALRLAEREKDTRNIEIACNGVGNTLMAIPGKEEEGLAYLEKALDIAKQVGNLRGIAIQNLTIGEYYDQLGQHRKARIYLHEILKINETRKDARGRGMGLRALGESYLAEGTDLQQAERYFDEALTVFQAINDRQQQANTLLEFGNLGALRQQYTQSLSKLEQAMRIAGELNDQELLKAIAGAISEHHEALNNYLLALRYYKMAQNYQDSINLTNQAVQVSAIARRYDVEKKESEIELLKAEQSVHELQLERRTTQFNARGTIIMLLVALFFVVMVVFLLRNRSRKDRVNAERMLAKAENERLKVVYEKNLMEADILASQMQINPHFLFNCLNSIKNMIQRNDNQHATKYLVKLARFARIVLETANKPVHSLHDELALMVYYIELEKNRFDDSFCYSIINSLKSEGKDISLPSLLLQPFVENAIWHGLLPSNKATKMLTITVKQTEGNVQVVIDDTGVGRHHAAKSTKRHKSRGTEINDKRIRLFNESHPNNIDYEFVDKKDEVGRALGTSVVIHMQTKAEIEVSVE